MEKLDAGRTALVLIDLQKGILAYPTAPRASDEVLGNAVKLAGAVKKAGGVVVLVKLSFSPDFGDALRQPVDQSMDMGTPPADWPEIPADLAALGDIVIVKRQWGAFYGTDLDLQLRRRGISTILLGGIATNLGVESTARSAYEHGYSLVFAEDATASMSPEMHGFACSTIFPLIGRMSNVSEISSALA